MSDWTPPADAKKVTPAASGWKPPSDAKKADGAPFPSAPPASGEEGLGGPAVSRVPSTNGYAPQPRHLETGGLRPFKGLDAAAPRRPQMTPTALSPNRGTREDGTNKGPGWLGSIPAADGKEMTELSFDFDVDGKNIFAPLLVPTLSEGEVALLASGGEPTDAIYKKAQDFAIQRLDQGKSPFKEDPRSIVKKEKAEEIDLIGADRTTQQPSTIQAPQFDITPATAKQKKKAEEDARIEDRYQSEFSSATEEEVQKAKSVNQSMRSSIPAMEGAFLEGVERLKQQGQLLTDQRQILDSMDPSDPAYQGALDQYNERVKAFRKEQSGIELEALVVDDLVKKSAIDEFLLNRREHAIKAGHGNIPAAMGYASLDMLGKSMAGTLDVIGKVIPTDQEILEFAGALPEGSGTESRKEWRNYLKDVEKAPTRLTGIDQFVTPEYVDKKKDESLFAGGLIAVAEMAPAIAAGMATGGAGMGASFFTSSYRDLDQEMQGEYWDQIPEAEKEAIKVGTSFVSAGLSTMGMKALAGKLPVVNDIFFRAARKFAPGMSPGQLRRIIDAETKSYVANVASKIGQGFAIEGTEELADYGQEELVKHLYENYKRDELGEKADTLFQNAESIDQLGEGAWKSFVIGGIAGNMIGGSVAALSSVGARKRLSEKEFGVFKDLLESGSLLKDIEPIMAAQVAAGEMSQSDFDKTMEDVSKAESAISQIPEGLDIKATREAFDLLLEKDKLKTKDKILSAPKMQKIDEKLAALVGGESDNRTDPTTAQEAHAARDKAKETPPVVVEEVEEVDDRETTRFIPENPTASEVDGYRVKYEGEEGYAYRDGQALVIETDGGRIYEIGNAEQLAGTNAAELGITIVDTAGDFQVQDDGSVKVGRNNYINNNEDLTDAIVVDGEGNVVSVSLAKKGSDAKGANTTDKHIDGLRVFRGQQAEDLAYEILQQQMEAVPETEGPRLTQVLLQEKQNYEADQRTKAATGKPAQGKKGKGPAQVPKAGQAKEQVTTPNENEQPSVNRGGSDSVVSNTETNIEATPASVPEGTGVGKNVETTAPPDTAPPTSVQDEAPKPVAKKEAPSPGQGEGTTKSPYHSTSGKKYGGFSVTYDPEIGKMKTTMLGTPPPSGAEKFPVGSKERAKKSSNRIKAIRKARQEAEDELARKLGIAKDGRFKRGGNALENREEEKERRAAISKKADRLDEDALGVYGVVLRAMADGDMKITPESIAKYLGWGGGRNDGAMAERRKTEEETKASWTLDDGGEHINNAAHGMMEGSTMKDADGDPMDGWSEADFAEAIAQVASGYTSSQEAYVQLERVADDLTEATLSPEDAITAHENAILNGLMEDADVEGNLDAAQASILNMSEAQLEAQYQDYLNTQRDENQEDTDGNDNQGAADSALGEQDDSGEEGASTVTEEDQDLADRISKLADDLDAPMAQRQSPERTTLETGKLRTDRVAAALKKLVPNLEIIAPKTKEEYAEATKDISEGLGSTWGIYDPRTNKLYLNPSSPDLRQTFFHEAAHPIIIALAKNNPELFSKFYEQLRTERGGKYIKFGQQYSDLSEAAQMAEALAEFFGDVAAGKVPVSTNPDSLYQQFKDFIKDILAALGWDMRSIDLSKPTDVREFAAQMKKAFDKGIAIEGFAPLEGSGQAMMQADQAFNGPETPSTPIGETKTVTVDGKEHTVFNSNGKPIHPTVEGVRNFWKWFGDSKVVNKDGAPVPMYHGGQADFDAFNKAFAGSGTMAADTKGVFFFTDRIEVAEDFAGYFWRRNVETDEIFKKFIPGANIMQVYLKMDDPAIWGMGGAAYEEGFTKSAIKDARKSKEDGVVFQHMADGSISTTGPWKKSHVMAVFKPTQIKSATGNYGTFDPRNPSVLAQRPYGPIPADAHKAALNAVAASVRAGEGLSKAITNGLKEVKASDWYKTLDATQQAQAEADFKAPIKALATPVDKKPSTAPKKLQKQVMEAAGKKPAPKIVVNEKAALKDQIRMAARIAKEAARSGAIAGEIHGRREERSAAEKVAEKARREADKTAQKRTDQGYSFGLAEGRTAGEIAGKREGRKEGAKETSDRIKESRKAFEKDVALALGGKGLDLSLVQSRAIAKEAARVDPTNDMQVSRFIDYAMKVMGNAEWADQVEQANIMRGRAAKASKRKSVPYNHKEVLKQASEVDPAILDNPGEYTDIVQRYLGNIASPLSSQYAGTEQITEGEFRKYLSEWEAQMDQKYEDLLMDELGLAVKKGQAKEIYKSIQEGTIDEALRQMDDPELKAEIESRVREMSQQRIAALKQHDTSGLDKEEVRIVKDIASADIDRLTVAQQADIIRASDNIILNNGFGGATLAASIASASNAVKPALDIAAKSGIRRALGIAQEFFSQSDAWTFFFGQAKDVGRIQNLVGFGDYVRGKAEFMKEQKKVRQDMEQFFSRLRAKYKDADSFENMTAEWVAGWVIQAMPKLNPKQSFEANKAMLQEDINRKMPTKSKKEAEMAQTVFDKIIAPANTREEALALLAKNYPSAKQSIDFMVNLFKPYRDRIQANSVRTWNMSGDYSDPYYLPKAFFTRGAKSLDVEPYSNKKNLTTMRPGQAGGTKARMTYRSLAENRLISPNIRNNVFSSLSDDLYGVATDAARMRLNEFMKMPDSNGVFGNEENKGFMAAMMHNYITAQDKNSGDQSEVSRWVNNRINDARTLASVQALAGFTQITRQLPEAVTQASVMMGRDFPLLFKNIPEVTVPSSPEGQGAADLMGNYAIGSREHAKAGMAWEGKVNSLNNAFQKAMQSGKFREAMKVRAKIQEVFMMSLMKGDLLSARAAWLGFYEKARKMDGHEVESWQTEASMHEGDTSRQDAALYADTMVNRMTVSSDPAQAARIAQRTKSPTANAFKALVQAFVGTAIQQVGRRYAEVSTLGGYAYKKATGQKTGEAYDPKRALMSLVAGTTGNAVFLGSRLLIASALRDAIGELYKWAVDDDDDDEEPSTKAKAIFGFMTALYMGGMMDSDIFRAIDKAERERGRKPKDPESESVKKYKLFKSQMLSEFIGSSIWQIADDAFIDGLNRMAYSAALDAGEPSAFTKGGDPKPFRTWLQDPKNAPFYRYGQTKFVDRDRWIPDLDDAGILGVFTKNAGYMLRNINNIFGDEETEYKNEYQKAVKDIREASKERTEKASDIVARYEAGELTKEQSNKEFEKTFKDLPKDEYNKAARAFLDKRRYADAPDNVKEVLDINSVPVRVKMVRDMRSTMNAAEKKAFDSELRKANVMTDSFLKEYKSVKK